MAKAKPKMKVKPKADHRYNKKLILWATVALIIGVLIGLIFTRLF